MLYFIYKKEGYIMTKKFKSLMALLALGSLTLSGCSYEDLKFWKRIKWEDLMFWKKTNKDNKKDEEPKQDDKQDDKDDDKGDESKAHFGDIKLAFESVKVTPEDKQSEYDGQLNDLVVSMFKDGFEIELSGGPFKELGVLFGTYSVDANDLVAKINIDKVLVTNCEAFLYLGEEDALDLEMKYVEESSNYHVFTTDDNDTPEDTSDDLQLDITFNLLNEAPKHVEYFLAPYLSRNKAGETWEKVKLNASADDELLLTGEFDFVENEEFAINTGLMGWKYYESYVNYFDTAGGKIVQGSDATETKHYFKVTEAGRYTISLYASGVSEYMYYPYVFIEHGEQQPYVMHGNDPTWTNATLVNDYTADYDVRGQVKCLGLQLEAGEEFVVNLGNDTWKHYEDFIDNRTSNGSIVEGTLNPDGSHNLRATESGLYDIYVTREGKIHVAHGEIQNVAYRFECTNDWDIANDNAVFYAYVYEYNYTHGHFVPLTLKGTLNNYYFEVELPATDFYLQICRMDPNYDDGDDDHTDDVPSWGAVWNQSSTFNLPGTPSTFQFSFYSY